MPLSNDPAAVVQRQLDAYNACNNLDALLAMYAKADAQLFEHPATLVASGAAVLRERFAARFQEPNLHATLLSRTVMGHMVVDHEEVSRTFPEGPGKIRLLMIYEVQNGRIARAFWTIAGEKDSDRAARRYFRSLANGRLYFETGAAGLTRYWSNQSAKTGRSVPISGQPWPLPGRTISLTTSFISWQRFTNCCDWYNGTTLSASP